MRKSAEILHLIGSEFRGRVYPHGSPQGIPPLNKNRNRFLMKSKTICDTSRVASRREPKERAGERKTVQLLHSGFVQQKTLFESFELKR